MESVAEHPPIESHPDAPAVDGARRPDRSWWVDADGVRIAAYEWGLPDAPPIVAAHGGFDFAGTFDLFAPLLVAGGYRVVSWDQRGHGDSQHTSLYSWVADLRDALAVLDDVGREPCVLLGHSKGGNLVLELAEALPHRVTHVVNLDGMPSKNNWPDVSEHDRTRMLHAELEGWLDHRRACSTARRKPGTLDELAERRKRMNPRLSEDWLRYLVTVGGRRDDDGWRWKIDPSMRLGGFGPWRPEWSMQRMPGLPVPVLGVLGLAPEMMGWGTRAADVEPWLPARARLVELDDIGHFVHVEQPTLVADLVLGFLGESW